MSGSQSTVTMNKIVFSLSSDEYSHSIISVIDGAQLELVSTSFKSSENKSRKLSSSLISFSGSTLTMDGCEFKYLQDSSDSGLINVESVTEKIIVKGTNTFSNVIAN